MTMFRPAAPAVAFDRTPMLGELRAATGAGRSLDPVLAGVEDILRRYVDDLDELIAAPDANLAGAAAFSRIVHAESRFSVVVLTLPPGSQTSIHDHLTWCAVAVVRGIEYETTFRDHGDRLEQLGSSRNLTGSVTTLLPPGDIHRVRNDGASTALSLHVYGADLRAAGSSVRRTYDLPVR